MKLFKTLIVWLLLLAIPLQGHAAMVLIASAGVPASPACAEMHGAAEPVAAAPEHKAHCEASAADHTCSNCSSCAMGAPFVPAAWPPFAYQPLGSELIAYIAAFVTSRLPDGLERPPHGLSA